MSMKKFILLIALFYISIVPLYTSFAVSTPDDFLRANQLYKSESYQDALRIYERLLTKYPDNFSLTYNIGNCYYKIGEYGKAKLYYEKSLRMKPRDRDLKYNIEILNEKLGLLRKRNLWETIKNYTFNFFNLREVSIITIILFWIFTIFFFLEWRTKVKFSYTARNISLLLFIIFLAIYLTNYYQQLHTKWGIVIAPAIEVKLAPREEEELAYGLKGGEKVKILREESDWFEIENKEGYRGWALKKEIGQI